MQGTPGDSGLPVAVDWPACLNLFHHRSGPWIHTHAEGSMSSFSLAERRTMKNGGFPVENKMR